MPEGSTVPSSSLADKLVETWAQQGRDGFLLTDPARAGVEVREASDPGCGVTYRFLWMPHREIRGDVAELERRGILNPQRNEQKLFCDERDPYGRHCFLCADNVRECNPMETLVPLNLAGVDYYAGANFAWIEPDHFTVMAAQHRDQAYAQHVVEAMLDLHLQTQGRFRVLFNGPGAGATIPWHLHYQITTEAMPIERLQPGHEAAYPTAVCRFPVESGGVERTHDAAVAWLAADPMERTLNLMVATIATETCIFFFPRDRRHATAEGKGLIGGFEVAGDFVLSAERERATFEDGSVRAARDILSQVNPPDWRSSAAA